MVQRRPEPCFDVFSNCPKTVFLRGCPFRYVAMSHVKVGRLRTDTWHPTLEGRAKKTPSGLSSPRHQV